MEILSKIYEDAFPQTAEGKALTDASEEHEARMLADLTQVTQLNGDGDFDGALQLAAEVAHGSIKNWNPWSGSAPPGPVVQSLIAMARILARRYPDIANRFDRTKAPPAEFYVQVAEAESRVVSDESFRLAVPLAAYLLLNAKSPRELKDRCAEVLLLFLEDEDSLVGTIPEPTFPSRALAEVYILGGLTPAISPTGEQRRALAVTKHLKHLGWPSNMATIFDLRFPYAVARDHLINGRLEDGHALLLTLFNERAALKKEVQPRAQRFISDLLWSFCEALNQSKSRDMLWGVMPDAFIDDLLEFSIRRECWEEAEVLVQEVGYRWKETRADSHNDKFWVWYQIDTGPQGILAQERVPQSSMYWEDSRTYSRTWQSVVMRPVFPADPMPLIPVCFEVSADKIECLSESTAELLAGSEILDILEQKRAKNDWAILSAFDQQTYRGTSKTFAAISGPHKFWIFPDDIIKPEEEGHHPTGAEPNIYRFRHLDQLRSEWMVVRTKRNRRSGQADSQEDFHQPIQTGHQAGTYMTVYPSTNVLHIPPYTQRRAMKYEIREAGPFRIDIEVDFIPWHHYSKSIAYRFGLTYGDYISCLADRLSGDFHWLDYRARKCTSERVFSPEVKLSLALDEKKGGISKASAEMNIIQQGFVNGVPSGNVVIAMSGLPGGVSFVSTNWLDWTRFTLYKTTPALTPKVTLSSGGTLNCLGYITGKWATQDNIIGQHVGLRLFVVDATFRDQESAQEFNFLLSAKSLCAFNLQHLTSPEMRYFCGDISPGLFRYAPPDVTSWGSKWSEFAKTTAPAVPDAASEHWEEMNRREKWDRSYEKRLRAAKKQSNPGLVTALEIEMQTESAARLKWDEANMSSSSSISADDRSTSNESVLVSAVAGLQLAVVEPAASK